MGIDLVVPNLCNIQRERERERAISALSSSPYEITCKKLMSVS